MTEIILQSLLEKTSFPSTGYTLNKLFGEASLREYFRLVYPDGKTLIIMKLPAGASSKAEEITKTDKPIIELPFLNIQKYLASLTLPVPKVLAYSEKDGLMVLEDLGDKTLEKMIEAATPAMKLLFYRQVLELLVALQSKTTLKMDSRFRGNDMQKNDKNCIAFNRQFDFNLLFWEFNHFIEYGLEDRLKLTLPGNEKKQLENFGEKICKKISKMPYGFTHRDFQSRNLMLYQYRWVMIDFQDALKGPLAYDLVALLRDSYIHLNLIERKELMAYYVKLLPQNHPYLEATKELSDDFDLITIQRKLKDAGRFQYINTVKKNPKFLTK